MSYPAKVYLNGRIVDHEDAKISVFDRGFIFGDGIYEVMVALAGKFFYGEEHLARLEYSLNKIKLKFDVKRLSRPIEELLEVTELNGKDALLYIQITRGVAPRKHVFPKDVEPTVLMYAMPYPMPDIDPRHLRVVTMEDRRWHQCDIKMTSLLGNILANENAYEHDAFESILIRPGVGVTEASHSNVFFVKDNVVYTHPANELILNGITRQIVIDLCGKLGIEVREEPVSESDIYEMDEAFLSGTTTQLASIRQVDDRAYYEGEEAGPVTRRLQEAFAELKTSRMRSD